MVVEKKCISGCKGLEPEICEKSPRCSYINGEKRQFCRLHKTYKLNKRDCSVRRKTSRNQKVIIVQKFMKNTTFKRRAEFLKRICSDSGFCYALGKNRAKLFSFFDGFVNFEYVKPPIVAIGNPSSNGFVKSVQYERHGYKASAVLKSSTKFSADNLAYEFLVGNFLNKMGNRFPCFVQTYGLYYYKDIDSWEHARDTKRISTNILRDSLRLRASLGTYRYDINDVLTDRVCSDSKYAALLIQHFNNVRTFGDFVDDMSKTSKMWCTFTLIELIPILYQIYLPLSAMRKVFTHYDLHHGNVLLYEPAPGKYIQYHYHHANEVITFKSRYLVKIIDYGRSFFKDVDVKGASSTDILKAVCALDDCNIQGEGCGDMSGFKYLTNTLEQSTHFMSSSEHNPSADLRFLHLIGSVFDEFGVNAGSGFCGPEDLEDEVFFDIGTMVDMVSYGVGLRRDQHAYGTKPFKSSGLPDNIDNVSDAEELIRLILINNKALRVLNDIAYEKMEKICDIHVYADVGINMRIRMAS